MRIIGITGGVGAGKSAILQYLSEHDNCRIEQADLVAHKLQEKGQRCYEPLIALLGTEILDAEGNIQKAVMAEKIFRDKQLLSQVNTIVHPAVKEYLLEEIDKEKKRGKRSRFFIEAALLIEDGYGRIADELWYIHADEMVRRKRLQKNRGYSDAKIDGIYAGQLTEAEFRGACSFVIDNSTSLEAAYAQIDKRLREYEA